MLKKVLRKAGKVIKKVAKVVAKPFQKVMGFMGRLGWVGTLAMMFAMPYLSGFWSSMTNGFSATWASSSYDRIGIIWSLDANRIRFSAGDSASMYTMSRTWGSSGKYEAENGSIRVYIWK